MLKMELGFSCWQLKSFFFLPFTYTILEGRITFSHPVVHKWKPLCQNLEFFCATTTVCKITYSTSVIHVGVGPTAGVTAEKCRWSSHEFRGKKVANQKSSTYHTLWAVLNQKRCKYYWGKFWISISFEILWSHRLI